MRRPSLLVPACLLLASPGLVAAAHAQTGSTEIVITSGEAGGNYDFLARRLRALVAIEQQQIPEIQSSEGSIQNLQRLDDPTSPVNVGFSQADALGRYLADNPGFREEFMVLSDVGRECLFLIAKQDGPVQRARDLKKPGDRTISVGEPESGPGVTYDFLSRLDPGFANTPPVNVDVMQSLLQLDVGGRYPEMASVLLVQSPLAVSPPLQVVLESKGRLRLVPAGPDDVEVPALPKLPNGQPVYAFEEVTLHHRGSRTEIETLCTRGLVLLAKSKLDESVRDELIAMLLTSSSSLAPAER